nr:MAG TPA: hypothetical protein [Caudoviricetes sp.]
MLNKLSPTSCPLGNISRQEGNLVCIICICLS